MPVAPGIETPHPWESHQSDLMAAMEVRRRAKAEGPDVPTVRSRSDSTDRGAARRSAALDRGCTRLIAVVFVCGACLTSVLLYRPQWVPALVHERLDRALGALGLAEQEYAVVIDAGSTGSRVLAFTFHRGLFDRQLRLDDELWSQIKPGLSSYTVNPADAGLSIQSLLEKAQARIPRASWAQTPLTLKATAGLRLLPPDQSAAILAHVETTLRASGFQPESNLIEIMNPMEEGLFGWFTVNFLAQGFGPGGVAHSLASLDLGGGSTQITFAPTAPVPGLTGRKHYTHRVSVLKQDLDVYSHSYLGLGLMTARQAIFQAGDQSALQSPCVRGSQALTWSFQGREYAIQSHQPSFDACLKLVQAVIKSENVHVPDELMRRRVVAFSYFYDKAKENGLIDPEGTEGTIVLGDYLKAAKRVCDRESGFHCVDLTFIYVLLSDGYGLSDNKTIQLYKKIDGHEVSWALGLAYNILERV
ncbi:hypothetical protein TCAL_04147 [Tigriopus californicus]|uniref:Ectonucleoside triphosphate diphosphohydrolase 5 n=1 Tax=Tigriopus californicus TaxID=6832 RepID=A0A553NVU7_TIGCA|nr:ectonucleoside triphosphate diphosphohydrolase 5-like [Tigriopus californicus]TRY69550.1 hypothetical protein TCAL_04147 [Tigriopus californicus]|eukprot:TCALIF_04147-PA protein Name:"Similar to Entpd5 Ectonucleoside triphosphate diphosphohydrolase 5 (Mus musculus)" AED:0.21 eAED:0.22 QI:0/-1/0/1/-1/1/1/0/473